MPAPARYDGIADWYDRYIRDDRSGFTAEVQATLQRLLGRGAGSCLDLGCGTGISIPTLAGLGWRVTGVDISADQLEVARTRHGIDAVELVQASADQLPFEDDAFDAAAAVLVHTDLDDQAAAFDEAARVLQPGAPFALVCVHPCFEGGHVEKLEDNTRRLHPGYHEPGWAPDVRFSTTGVRARVGVNHLPLATLLNLLLDAGFLLDRFEEDTLSTLPHFLGIRAVRRS